MLFIYCDFFLLQGLFVFLVYGLGQRSIRMAILRRKYRPASSIAAGTSQLVSSHASSNSSLQDSTYVDVKPQPMNRPSSKKSKSSPRPPSAQSTASMVGKGRRKSRRSSDASTASSNGAGCK